MARKPKLIEPIDDTFENVAECIVFSKDLSEKKEDAEKTDKEQTC